MTEKKEYEHWVAAQKIEPMADGIKWAAKAKIKEVGTGRSDDFITLSERYGKTRGEAESKAEAAAEAWIADQEA
jgi:hypothetical protein